MKGYLQQSLINELFLKYGSKKNLIIVSITTLVVVILIAVFSSNNTPLPRQADYGTIGTGEGVNSQLGTILQELQEVYDRGEENDETGGNENNAEQSME